MHCSALYIEQCDHGRGMDKQQPVGGECKYFYGLGYRVYAEYSSYQLYLAYGLLLDGGSDG